MAHSHQFVHFDRKEEILCRRTHTCTHPSAVTTKLEDPFSGIPENIWSVSFSLNVWKPVNHFLIIKIDKPLNTEVKIMRKSETHFSCTWQHHAKNLTLLGHRETRIDFNGTTAPNHLPVKTYSVLSPLLCKYWNMHALENNDNNDYFSL